MPESVDVQPNAGSPDASHIAAMNDRYVINNTVSRFTVQAFASGLLSAFGHDPKIAIRDLKGEIHFDPAHIEKSTMHLVVRADSLSVTDNISDKDRRDIESEMRAKVLETDKYPEIVFDVSGVTVKKTEGGQIERNTERPADAAWRYPAAKGSGNVAVTGDMLRAFGEFPLRQSDYNIKPISAVGGGLKVKDEVKFAFDIVARKDS